MADFSTTQYGNDSQGEVTDPFGKLRDGGFVETWRALSQHTSRGASAEEAIAKVGLTPEDLTALESALGVRKAKDPKAKDEAAISALAAQLNPEAYSGMSKHTGVAGDKLTRMMAGDLARYGIKDLSEVEAHTLPTGEAIFRNKATGAIIPTTYGSDTTGEGRMDFRLVVGSDGAVVPMPKWKDTSDRQSIISALSVLALPVAGYLAAGAAVGTTAGAAAGSTTAAGAAATTAGTTSGISLTSLGQTFATNFGVNMLMTGGDLDQSFMGAVRSTAVAGVGQLASPLIGAIDVGNVFANNVLQAGATQAVGAGATTLVRGGDLGDAVQEAGRGFVTGAAGSAANQLTSGLTGSARAGRLAGGTVAGAVGAAQSGDSAGEGAARGLVNAGLRETGLPGPVAGAISNTVVPPETSVTGRPLPARPTTDDLGSMFYVGRATNVRVSAGNRVMTNNRIGVRT